MAGSRCDKAMVTWGSGESQVLSGLIIPDKAVLMGAAVGKVGKKKDLILGQDLKAGDIMIGIESNGVHANGITDISNIAKNLPSGFSTRMPSGEKFGDSILKPSHIYTDLMKSLWAADLTPKYVSNITGHGWQKIMRNSKELKYVIDSVPEPSEEFKFIQETSGFTDEQMYSIFNMGIGYVLFASEEQVESILNVVELYLGGLEAYELGRVEEGSRMVDIRPLGIQLTKLGIR